MFHQSTEYLIIGTLIMPKIVMIDVILNTFVDVGKLVTCGFCEESSNENLILLEFCLHLLKNLLDRFTMIFQQS